MTRNAVVVPVRVDLLVVTETTATAGPSADFSGLPWNDGRRDVNPGRPHLAAEVADTPFEEAAARLPVGIHLHWTLPAALTRGRHRPAGDTPEHASTVASVDFPIVPNRWLVDAPDGWWVVESDYVHPEGGGDGAVTYLLPPAERERLGSRAPYRRVGRQVPVREWRHHPDAQYLHGLTALGWGHPAFHAYHPNCHSVFGFHHAAPEDAHPAAAAYPYRVFGWYSRLAHDPVTAAGRHRDDAELAAFLREEYRWATTGPRPERLLCAGRWEPGPPPPDGVTHVVLGATGGEALAAHLADRNADMDQFFQPGTDVPALLEELAESFLLASRIDPARPDAAPALWEARHDKEFVAVPGGTGWTIRARGPAGPADATRSPAGAHGSAPAAAAARLAALTGLQHTGDRLGRTAETLRAQLYADWCAYLQCKYPPRGSTLDRPDVDEVRRHVEVTSLAALEAIDGEALAAARDRAAVALEIVGELAAADVSACEVRAEDVADWAALADRATTLRMVPPKLAALVRDRPDDAGLRADVLRLLRAVVRSATPPGGGPPPADPVSAVDRTAAALLPDHPDLAAQWRETAAGHVRSVLAALRNREVLEDLMHGQVRVAPKVRHELAPRPGPRFWRPRDPVVLLAGPSVAPGDHPDRRGEDVPCAVVPIHGDPAVGLVAALGSGAPGRSPVETALAVDAGSGHNGHPVMLDWSVALHEEPGVPPGDPGYLTSRYTLVDDRPEIVARAPDEPAGRGRTSLVTGRGLLSPHPVRALAHALARRPPLDPKTADYFVEEFAERVRLHLRVADVQVASLSGLHAALLMHEPVVLPVGVADPHGFPEARAFADRVAAAIGPHALAAPRPQLHFMPLRASRVRLAGLQLVDGFGRVRPVPVDGSLPEVRGTEAVPSAAPSGGPTFALPPRLVPPARLAMRWLAAGSAAHEAHDHPTTGPVCGWLVPDLLDNTLVVHDADGQAIGSVDGPGRWRPAPGRDRIVPPEDIGNPHLRRVALHLMHLAVHERDSVFAALAAGLDRIEPDRHGAHRALSLLVGRPMAVVRASVRLELLGAPPVDQSWSALRSVLTGGVRGGGGLAGVQFPLRLGEHARLDDGLLGFWVERGSGFDGGFRPPRGVAHGRSVGGGHIALTVDAPAVHLTLLVDPRAAVHATTGILPTKVLRIPPEQYATALDGIGVTFLTAPLLTDPDTVRVARPDEPGHTWSWLERTPDGWHEIPAAQLGTPRSEAAFAGPQELREGWLRLTPVPDAGGGP